METPTSVIFDFDGTLVDSLMTAWRLTNQAAPIFGFTPLPEDEIPLIREMTTRQLCRHMGIPLAQLPALARYVRREMMNEVEGSKLFDGVTSLLHRLKDRGIVLGVVTSNSAPTVKECLARNHVLELFDFVYSSSNLFGKHRTLRRMLSRFGMDPGRVFYVGDEARDVEAARKVGIGVVSVTWGFHSRGLLKKVGPDVIVDEPGEIGTFFLGNSGPS